MRKYYLFMIKTEYYKLYKNKPNILYETLTNLYYLREPNFQYGISLFDSICQPFAVKLLTNYIKNKHTCTMESSKIIKVHSIKEKTYLQINHSCCILKTNVNFPEILKVFHIYNKKIFIVDFNNKDYFWLETQIQRRK